jgi:hypothetical protein
MMAHGAAMLMIGKTILPRDVKAARTVFTASVKALLRQDHEVPRRSGVAGLS